MDQKPDLQSLLTLCPDVGEEFAREFLDRLEEDYFIRFPADQVARHANALAGLGGEQDIDILVSANSTGEISCSVIASDFPGIFSIITGLLAASGFSIRGGEIFTYAQPISAPAARSTRPGTRRSIKRGKIVNKTSRRIIDVFTGISEIHWKKWAELFERQMREVYGILQSNSPSALDEARKRVDEEVVVALNTNTIKPTDTLMPVQIDFDTSNPGFTCMTVTSQDTPFFLFSLSNALSLHDVSIERVEIRTIEHQIQDEIRFVDLRGKAISSPQILNAIKLSVVFTKQFTYFLGGAPDPYAALGRFVTIVHDMKGLETDELKDRYLSNPRVLGDLARLLGTSDFLWEDFIRLQYENLIPVLTPAREGEALSTDPEALRGILNEKMAAVSTTSEKVDILNTFKDQEAFLIDLEHIISRERDFFFLSSRLSRLAEVVVNAAVEISYEEMANRYGKPLGYAGIEAKFAIMGLGKLGGEALGYASDIELLFLYDDSGSTEGPEVINNAEFFERCFKDATANIKAKREGIFQVDLRLRPHGKAGPIACSLESFVQYYGPDGPSHNLERLALVRMRAIGGDSDLGSRIERLRDEMIYATEWIDTTELRAIREVQLKEKSVPGRINAKFNPGGLVDLEYTVQIIQCMYGRDHPELRTSSIHTALEKLVEAGHMSGDEADRLIDAYRFMRDLINGLRMLRGSAVDLFLPPEESDEFVHLARRMGYKRGHGLSPAQQLHFRFDTKSADIRSFIEDHFGRESIPGPEVGNAADLVLSEHLSDRLVTKILGDSGFRNTERALRNIRGLAGDGSGRRLFARLAVLAFDVLDRSADPDMALNNWERFVSELPDREAHYDSLLSQPGRLEILMAILSGSQFLADTLIRNPDFLEWVTDPRHINRVRSRTEMMTDLQHLSESTPETAMWLKALRKFRKREILRIGARDICMSATLEVVTEELTNLAEAIIEMDLTRIWHSLIPDTSVKKAGFCILAFGKLGGQELNYSSDIDLLITFDETKVDKSFASSAAKIVEKLRADLSNHSDEGYVYRVDLRLRPFGNSGPLVPSTETLKKYYQTSAAPWELQALLKLRPIAGDIDCGKQLLIDVLPLLAAPRDPHTVAAAIDRLRELAIKVKTAGRHSGIDVKSGRGGIRDIEFLIQGLQMIHLHTNPEIKTGNTLTALNVLKEHGVLAPAACTEIADDYRFLRRLEHFLQVFDDRQTHTLPESEKAREAVSKRMGISTGEFSKEVEQRMSRVRNYYEQLLINTQ